MAEGGHCLMAPLSRMGLLMSSHMSSSTWQESKDMIQLGPGKMTYRLTRNIKPQLMLALRLRNPLTQTQNNDMNNTGRPDRLLPIVLTLTALAELVWLIFFWRDFQTQPSQMPKGVSINIDPSVSLMHVRIAVALVIAAIGTWVKKVAAFLLSFAALIWVIAEYGCWYEWSVAINRESGFTHTYGLYGANPLNWTIIMVVSGLLVWELTMILNLGRAR
ncbi:MAG: hypothetical protein ACREBG_24345 [Pyrinomonadaceae bacterium]